MRIYDRKSSADTKAGEEGGGGSASGTEAVVKTKTVPLQPWRIHGVA